MIIRHTRRGEKGAGDQLLSVMAEIKDSQGKEFNQIFPALVITSSMGNSSFLNFESYRKLIEETNTDDLALFALEEIWFRIQYGELNKEQKKDENVKTIKKKIYKKMEQIGIYNIDNQVNIPINKVKTIEGVKTQDNEELQQETDSKQ